MKNNKKSEEDKMTWDGIAEAILLFLLVPFCLYGLFLIAKTFWF